MRSLFRVERADDGGPTRSRATAAKPGSGARFQTMTSEIEGDPLRDPKFRDTKFDSPSLTEKSWFSGLRGVGLACGGVILFALLFSLGLALVFSIIA